MSLENTPNLVELLDPNFQCSQRSSDYASLISSEDQRGSGSKAKKNPIDGILRFSDSQTRAISVAHVSPNKSFAPVSLNLPTPTESHNLNIPAVDPRLNSTDQSKIEQLCQGIDKVTQLLQQQIEDNERRHQIVINLLSTLVETLRRPDQQTPPNEAHVMQKTPTKRSGEVLVISDEPSPSPPEGQLRKVEELLESIRQGLTSIQQSGGVANSGQTTRDKRKEADGIEDSQVRKRLRTVTLEHDAAEEKGNREDDFDLFH